MTRFLLALFALAAGCSSPGSSTTPDAVVAAPPAAAPAPAPAPQPSRSFADFRPSLHGFAFRNDFSGSSLPINLGAAEKKLGLPSHFGLCGGMSFAAADYFLARRAIPDDATQPEHGTPLYTYIYSRQSASFGTMNTMALRFIEWMRLPEDGPDGTRARTAPQIAPIEAALSRGEPVILGLVLVSTDDTREPWHNHQVLAYASTRAGRTVEFRIYDPNFPKRDDAVIRVEESDAGPVCTRLVPGRSSTHVRGLFRMPYAPVDVSRGVPAPGSLRR